MSLVAGMHRWLDRGVAGAHALATEAGTHPQEVAWGAALLAVPAAAGVASLALAERPWVPATAALAAIVAYHALYLPLKRAVVRGARRQLLLDLVSFVLPAFLALGVALGERLSAMTDLAALVIPVGIGVLRAGCLFTGCCHGRPAPLGVRYPGAPERVLPLPLFEVLFAVALEAWLLAAVGGEPGDLLPRLAVAYGAYRFGSEFFRARTVARFGGLTASQALAGAAAVVGAILW
jgi:hypothetical protein